MLHSDLSVTRLSIVNIDKEEQFIMYSFSYSCLIARVHTKFASQIPKSQHEVISTDNLTVKSFYDRTFNYKQRQGTMHERQ